MEISMENYPVSFNKDNSELGYEFFFVSVDISRKTTIWN